MVIRKDEIVISGISCRLPESENIEEFKEHLMNKDDMVTDDDRRWPPGYYGLPNRHAKLKDIKCFDAAFFGVSPKQAHMMDPQLRILLEVAHEAILDAGLNPQDMRGTKTGVFVGCSNTETQDVLIQDPETVQGYSLTGCQHSMFANRLSYSFDFKGPSFSVDTACSSSLLAFQLAVDSIRQGNCDAALVCGTHLTMRPTAAMQFLKLSMLSPQGKCQSFDANGDGYVRAEGVIAVFLQKESDTNRIYAEVVHAKSNVDGFKEQGITFPNGNEQANLLRTVYTEAGVDPADVYYVECHGTGTKVGDPQEANAVAEVLCKNRKTPLLIGSVKSNMGHAEPSSGLASMCKLMIAMESGYIAPNLHFREPNPNIPALLDGRMKVVTEKTPIEDGIIGINSFGFGGANTHVILRARSRSKAAAPASTSKLRIVTYLGRTHQAVDQALTYFEKKNFDEHLYALMAKHSMQSATSHPYRGYMLYNRTGEVAPTLKEIQKIPTTEKRPVWFIYSGMGTHYAGMGKELMQIEFFEKIIRRCSDAVKPYNVDPYDLIMNGGADGPYCAVCICAIQIALTETLKYMGVEPDGIAGHSFGEMAAGYADGCMSLEETMLCAYFRTLSVMEQKFPPGAMAVVGMTWEETKARCPAGVVAACHNAKDTITISGDKDAVEKFTEQLKDEGIFTREVNSAGIAFHSDRMKLTAKSMKERLEKIVKVPKKRSPKWISTSVPESKWDTPLGQYCSPDYHVNNAVSPVLFYEALQHVPENAVLIEISPHCLLQAVVRRCVSSSCTTIGLLKARHENNYEFFLQNLGKIYASGLPLDMNKLFPPLVRTPVPRGAPMLSPMIGWDHSQSWFIIDLDKMAVSRAGVKANGDSVVIDVTSNDSEDKYMIDHCIDGRVLYPFAGHVVLAWKTFCKVRNLEYLKTPICIENMSVYRATILGQQAVKLDVDFSAGNGTFEIMEGDQLAACGKISIPEDLKIPATTGASFPITDRFAMTGAEVYKELRLRGYDYGPHFRPIQKASEDCRRTELAWSDNFVPYIDALLQAYLISEKGDSLHLPVRLRYLAIDPVKHTQMVVKNQDNVPVINTVVNPALRQCVSGGILMRDLVSQTVARRPANANGKLMLEKSDFTPYFDDRCMQNRPEKCIKLNEYQKLCYLSILNIFSKMDKAGITLPNAAQLTEAAKTNKDLIQDIAFLDTVCSKEKDAHLLRVLKQLLDSDFSDKATLKKMPQILEQGFKYLHVDKLWNSAYQEQMIKPLLDLITENTSGHFLKACQIEPDDEHLAKRCRDIQTTQPMLECEWSIYGQNVDQLDADLLAENELQATKLDFDKIKVEETEDLDFILLDRVLHRKTNPSAFLKNVADLLRPDGFVVVCETTDCFEIPLAMLALRGQLVAPQKDDPTRRFGIFYDRNGWTSLFEKCGFHVVSRRSADPQSMMTLFLLRRPFHEEHKSQTINVDDVKEFGWLKPLQKAVDESDEDKIWLTSEASRDNGAVGMGLCLRAEVSNNRIRTMINSNLKDATKPLTVKDAQVQKIMANDMHSNIYRDGTWGTFRHIPVKDDELHNFIETEHAFINTLIPGDLGSLTWVDSPNKFFSPTDAGSSNKILCDVHYAPLNFRDIMLATGRLSGDSIPGEFTDRECLLGLEFSGRCPTTGQTVMGLAKAQALATTVLTEKRFTWAVPKGWTLEQASTVPVAYTTAYYALVIRGRIKAGDKVLIHAGSGGVGQAAIAVALSIGCEVFTTVSSPEKKKFLQDRFPGRLQDKHFANSRSTDFEQHVLEMTEGRGVDAVLNSLSEDKLQASVRCLAQHGRFLEIGKFDLSNNSQLGMAIFLKNVSFHGILLDALFDDNSNDWLEVSRLFEEGLKNGTVKPLPTSVFPASQATDAFRFMAQGKHIGKVLLQVRPGEEKTSLKVNAVRRTLCNPRHSFIITGGLGGFGLELAQWLIKRGARKLVLTSRTGIKTGYQNRCCSSWKKLGVEILISKADISKQSGCEQLIKEAQQMGPLAGLFHLAMVLRDNIFENQTVQNFKESAEAKYWGTTYLDQTTRKMCGKDLHWFVVFSSISCGRGNAGQTNYGWTNSTMERIIEKRRADGFSGMAVQWGAIGDVGVVLETMGDNNTVVGGTLPQRIPSCMQAMDLFLSWNHPIVSSFVRAETATASRTGGEGQTDAVKMVAQIMGVSDPASIDHNAQFGDLGLDSLMGVEIKQALERNFSLNLSPKEIRTMTLNKLREATTSTKSKSSSAPAKKLPTEQNGSVANGSTTVTA